MGRGVGFGAGERAGLPELHRADGGDAYDYGYLCAHRRVRGEFGFLLDCCELEAFDDHAGVVAESVDGGAERHVYGDGGIWRATAELRGWRVGHVLRWRDQPGDGDAGGVFFPGNVCGELYDEHADASADRCLWGYDEFQCIDLACFIASRRPMCWGWAAGWIIG